MEHAQDTPLSIQLQQHMKTGKKANFIRAYKQIVFTDGFTSNKLLKFSYTFFSIFTEIVPYLLNNNQHFYVSFPFFFQLFTNKLVTYVYPIKLFFVTFG